MKDGEEEDEEEEEQVKDDDDEEELVEEEHDDGKKEVADEEEEEDAEEKAEEEGLPLPLRGGRATGSDVRAASLPPRGVLMLFTTSAAESRCRRSANANHFRC